MIVVLGGTGPGSRTLHTVTSPPTNASSPRIQAMERTFQNGRFQGDGLLGLSSTGFISFNQYAVCRGRGELSSLMCVLAQPQSAVIFAARVSILLDVVASECRPECLALLHLTEVGDGPGPAALRPQTASGGGRDGQCPRPAGLPSGGPSY